MGNAPAKKFNLGNISIAAFVSDKGGISFTLPQKRQKNQQGEWENARYLFGNDLATVRVLVDEAIRWAIHCEQPGRSQPSQVSQPPAQEAPPIDDDSIPF